MSVISTLLLILFVIICLLMIGVVLIQDDQGDGLGAVFGGGSSSPFGSQSGNVLTKFTTFLGAMFLILSLGLTTVNRSPSSDDVLGAARKEKSENQSNEKWWQEEEAAPAEEAETDSSAE